MKTGIVCEGGGMRGVFTSGVLQSFMDSGFMADVLVGVSAGASNGVSYVSGQKDRGYRTNVDYAGDKRYVSKRNFLKTGSIFGMDFVFGEIPEKLDPFDYQAFYDSPCDFYAGVTNINTGRVEYFGKEDIKPPLEVIRASCSIPVLSNIVQYKGEEYLDGGVADPIPLSKALELDCDRLIIILTQPRGYRKEPQSFRQVYKTFYRNYPNLVKALDRRYLMYNGTLKQVAKLEEEGKAIVIAPPSPLQADRFGQDKEKLIASYNIGVKCGKNAIKKL